MFPFVFAGTAAAVRETIARKPLGLHEEIGYVEPKQEGVMLVHGPRHQRGRPSIDLGQPSPRIVCQRRARVELKHSGRFSLKCSQDCRANLWVYTAYTLLIRLLGGNHLFIFGKLHFTTMLFGKLTPVCETHMTTRFLSSTKANHQGDVYWCAYSSRSTIRAECATLLRVRIGPQSK